MTSFGRYSVNCLATDSGFKFFRCRGVTFLILLLAKLIRSINALLTRFSNEFFRLPVSLSR